MCDIDEYTPSNIMFLRGVYMKNCRDVGDIMSERLAEMVMNSTQPTRGEIRSKHTPLPRSFTSIDKWPKSTNFMCCECGCSFPWEPVFIPTSIQMSGTKVGQYGPIKREYVFCGFVCAGMFADNMYSNSWEKRELLKLLHQVMTGVKIIDIPTGPHRTAMVQYGGHMTIRDFQHKNRQLCLDAGIKFPFGMFKSQPSGKDVVNTYTT